MRRATKLIASILASVLLATVLAPSFGWDATAGADTHDQQATGLGDSCAVHDRIDSVPNSDRDAGDSHHHACAAHMFGHLVADVVAIADFSPPESGSGRLAEPPPAALAAFPERLYRPPLARLLA